MDQLSTRFILYLKIIYRKIKKHYSSFIYIASCYIKTISLFVRSLYQNHKMSLAVSGDNWAKPYPYWIFLQIVALIQLLQVTQKYPGFREFDWVHFCIFYCLSCNMRKWVKVTSRIAWSPLLCRQALSLLPKARSMKQYWLCVLMQLFMSKMSRSLQLKEPAYK